MTKVQIKSTAINKDKYINELFSKIANKYDLLNNIMTFGLHKIWKEEAIKLALKEINNPPFAIDLCSGTADLAIILNKHSPSTKILCIDNCIEMQRIAEAKINKLHIKNISFSLLNLENLTLESSSCNLATIGFGLRNLANREKCLEEIYRVLKAGGVFACIDLGYLKNEFFQYFYNFYFFELIPKLGEVFAQNKEAYSYLTESLSTWYKQEELKDLVLSKGFKKCYFKNIFGGAVSIHIAVK